MALKQGDQAVKVTAAELQSGDVVKINAHTKWRVDEIERVTDKMIYYRFTYLRCDYAPSSVGTSRHYRHWLGTTLEVAR